MSSTENIAEVATNAPPPIAFMDLAQNFYQGLAASVGGDYAPVISTFFVVYVAFVLSLLRARQWHSRFVLRTNEWRTWISCPIFPQKGTKGLPHTDDKGRPLVLLVKADTILRAPKNVGEMAEKSMKLLCTGARIERLLFESGKMVWIPSILFIEMLLLWIFYYIDIGTPTKQLLMCLPGLFPFLVFFVHQSADEWAALCKKHQKESTVFEDPRHYQAYILDEK